MQRMRPGVTHGIIGVLRDRFITVELLCTIVQIISMKESAALASLEFRTVSKLVFNNYFEIASWLVFRSIDSCGFELELFNDNNM